MCGSIMQTQGKWWNSGLLSGKLNQNILRMRQWANELSLTVLQFQLITNSIDHTDDKYSKVISISDATGVDKEPADLSTFMFGLIDHCSSDFVPGETR